MNAQTKLSAKGQVVIPKDVRERLRWDAGTRLEVVERQGSVSLKAVTMSNPFPRVTLEEFRNRPKLKWDGPSRTVEEISGLDDEILREIFDERDGENSRY